MQVVRLKTEKVLASVESEKYELVEITVDSGAAESVCPPDLMSQFPTKETPSSLNGEQFVAANGAIIENEGERRVSLITMDGIRREMAFQVTGVNKVLASVSRMNEKGHVVVYDGDNSYIQNKATGEQVPMKKRNGVWVLEVWVEKSPNLSNRSDETFRRQGA